MRQLRTLHPKKSEYTFFSNAFGTFSRIDHMLGHKTNLNKFKSIELISSILSDHKKSETRDQPEEKKWEKKWQHATKKLMVQGGNQKGN